MKGSFLANGTGITQLLTC